MANSDLVSALQRTNERHRPWATSGNNRLFQNFPGADKCKLGSDGVSRGALLRYSKRGLDPRAELDQTAVEAQARAGRAAKCADGLWRDA